ncbi:MAG: HPP family protein [Candidatus Parvarchaeum sp.]
MKKNELSHREYRKLKHKFNRNNILIPLIATSFVVVFLIFVLHEINFDIREISGASALIFTSFASSAFILFLMPYSKAAKKTRFVKSYLIAGFFGYLGFLLSSFINFYIIAGTVIFIVSFLLFETDSEHPPAIGIAVAFMIFRIPIYGILSLLTGVIILVAAKYIMQKIGILSKASEFKVR